jgi:carotenoid cleavage dioxygenase
MSHFPDTPAFTGFNTPSRIEGDAFDLAVEGTIPPEINGAFYRVQPDPQFPPLLGNDIPFNGDGMITMFSFENGRVHFRQRWARTDKWKLEHAAGRSLFGAYRNPLTDDPAAKGTIRGTANTNIFHHGGRLYALKEDSPALVMELETLETIGYTDFGGRMTGETFTAHPKIDPETGELVFFGYAAKGETTRDIAYYVADAHGRIVREEWLEAPYPAEIHDFAVTREHVLFAVLPTTTSLERLRAGGPHWLWDPTRQAEIAIFSRQKGVRSIRWFKGPARWLFHFFNAYSVGSQVVAEACVSQAQTFPFMYPDTQGGAFDPAKAVPRITRWSFDLSSSANTFEERTLWTHYCEFPRIDDRIAMAQHRYGFVIANEPSRDFKGGGLFGPAFNTIVRYDFATGATESFALDENSTAQEPVFVPRTPEAPEADGYLLVLVNRFDTMLNDLLVLDTLRIAAGPIAAIKLPIRLRNGVHGNWVPQHLLDFARARRRR